MRRIGIVLTILLSTIVLVGCNQQTTFDLEYDVLTIKYDHEENTVAITMVFIDNPEDFDVTGLSVDGVIYTNEIIRLDENTFNLVVSYNNPTSFQVEYMAYVVNEQRYTVTFNEEEEWYKGFFSEVYMGSVTGFSMDTKYVENGVAQYQLRDATTNEVIDDILYVESATYNGYPELLRNTIDVKFTLSEIATIVDHIVVKDNFTNGTMETIVDDLDVLRNKISFQLDLSTLEGYVERPEQAFVFELHCTDNTYIRIEQTVNVNTRMYDVSTNPISITTEEEFLAISNNPNGYYILDNDLNFSTVDYEMIPEFNGVLDGNGHSISNVTIVDNEHMNVGLFGVLLENSAIYNLALENINISSTQTTEELQVGTLAGASIGLVTNVEGNNVTISTNINNQANIGGLIGRDDSNDVIDVHLSNANLQVDGYGTLTLGGIAGVAEGIYNATVDATITANLTRFINPDYSSVGGIAGELRKGSNLFVEGEIANESDTGYTGGIVGRTLSFGELTYLSSDASISVSSDISAMVGGLVGYSETSIFMGISQGRINAIDVFELQIGGLVGYSYGAPIYSSVSVIDQMVYSAIVVHSGGLYGDGYIESINGNYIVSRYSSRVTIEEVVGPISGTEYEYLGSNIYEGIMNVVCGMYQPASDYYTIAQYPYFVVDYSLELTMEQLNGFLPFSNWDYSNYSDNEYPDLIYIERK